MKNAELWYDEAMFWGKLAPGKQFMANTYAGHRWNIRVDGNIVREFVIGEDESQTYTI